MIQVRPGARIEITPVVEGQNISLDDVYILWSSDAPDKAKNKVNDRGAIELPRLPAGKELLMAVYAPDDGPVLFSNVKKIELAEGDHHQLRMELKPGVRIEGRLTGPVERTGPPRAHDWRGDHLEQRSRGNCAVARGGEDAHRWQLRLRIDAARGPASHCGL